MVLLQEDEAASSSITGLSEVLDQYAESIWITDMESLKLLEQWQGDKLLLSKIEETKLLGKHNLSNYIFDNLGVLVDPSSMFDIQVKRIHEYKRQHLMALWVVSQYLKIKNGKDFVPRTVIFGGKAVPRLLYGKTNHPIHL